VHLARLDVLLVAGVGGAAVAQLAVERVGPVVWLVAAATIAPLALRRRFPIGVCLAVLAGDLGVWALGWHLVGDAPAGLAVYSAARYAPMPRALTALVAAQVWVGGVLLTRNVDVWSDVLGAGPVLAGIWVLGVMVRRNRHQTALLRALTERLRREQAANAHRAVAEERARIARELHDTVSHHIAAIAVQAQATRLHLDGEAEGSDEQPVPTVGNLDELFAAAGRAGLRLESIVDEWPPDLPGTVQTCVYRLVQESLTNVIKHAGPVRVRVRLARTGEGIIVTVENEPGTPLSEIPGAGAGLAGLRTRVETFGGHLHAGPDPDGWFRVHATIPAPVEVGAG
jgi:signal transduction histidine kinase